MMAEANVNPTVTVPVAAVELINRAFDLLGEEMLVTVCDQEIDGLGYLENAFVSTVAAHNQRLHPVTEHSMSTIQPSTEKHPKSGRKRGCRAGLRKCP